MYEQYLEKFSFWPNLNDNEKKLLTKSIIINYYTNKQLVYSPASDCLGVFLVLNGTIRIYLTDEHGNTATILRLHKDDVCVLSNSCLISEITFDAEMISEDKSELLIIPSPVYGTLSKNNVYVENFSYRQLTEKFSNIMNAIQKLLFMSLEQRIISFLIDESISRGSDTLKITHEEIAECIDSAREAVSRILTKLSNKNLIQTKRGVITITNKIELYKYISGR